MPQLVSLAENEFIKVATRSKKNCNLTGKQIVNN